MTWLKSLRYDPVVALLDSKDEILIYFTRRDLLGEKVPPIDFIWKQQEAQKIFKNQQQDGSWPAKSDNRLIYPAVNYSLIETWKKFRFIVDQFQFNKKHDHTRKAAEYVFSCQSDEGDIRGILAGQYAIYYTGALMSLLIKAGYENDPRIENGFRWLLSMRQNDGGWVANNIQTLNLPSKKMRELTGQTLTPLKDHDKSRPFSSLGTGMVLRAFAAHEKYRHSAAAHQAARLLKSKFFKPGNYTSYRHPDNWVRFQFPFWWNNLVAALDSLSLMGIPESDIDIKRAVDWLVVNQQKNGLWKESYSKLHKAARQAGISAHQRWISLAICRILKRLWAAKNIKQS